MITVDFSRLAIQPGYRILDMGCGNGRHVSGAYQYKDVQVVGADLCFEDLQKARERMDFHDNLGAHGGGRWALLAANILTLPFPDNSFDLVICSEVMEHIPDHAGAMEELIRVLKPGQNLVISVPRYFPEKICWMLSDAYFDANQGHVRIYRKKELIAMARARGLTHWDTSHAHSLHSPYWWLKCLVGPARTDSWSVNLYHRFLTWDIMKKPAFTRYLDFYLNPILAKSLVLYFRKPR